MSFEQFIIRQTGHTYEEVKEEFPREIFRLRNDFDEYIASLKRCVCHHVHDNGALEFRHEWYRLQDEYATNWGY